MSDSETAIDRDGRDGDTLTAPTGEQRHASEDTYPRGTMIGRYIVLGIAGHGGMGVVYRAYDPNLQREVALKLLRGRRSNQAAAEARLRREAQAMARVSHPNVLPVYDVGLFESRVFVAMEYLEGETLGDWLERAPRGWREIVAMFLQAARGLAAAHHVGLVHRDFKPQNVIIGADGRARVMDFGLARVAGPDLSSSGHGSESGSPTASPIDTTSLNTQLTAVGSVVGTPRYMAPEQHFAGTIDGRSDEFSFCVALYEALFRVRAFVGENLVELAQRKQDGELAHVDADGEAPPWVRRVVMRGMSGNTDERYATMDGLVEALERDPSLRRRRLALGLGAAVMVSAAVGGTAFVVATQRPCRDADRKLEGVWDDDRRAEVERAIADTGVPFAPDTARLIRSDLDTYTQRWVEVHDEACAATKIHGEQSEELLDLRILCLDRQRRELAALVDLFTRADAGIVEQAVRATASLAGPDECGNAEELLARTRAPADPTARQRIEWIEEQLAQGRAMARGGKAREAVDVLQPAAVAARDIGWRPLQAEVVGSLADGVVEVGELARGRDLTIEALGAALAGNSSRLAAHIAMDLAYIDGYELQRSADAHHWASLARSIVEGYGGDGKLEAGIDNAEAITLLSEGQFDRAQQLFDGALARMRVDDPDDANVATLASNVGGMLAQRGQYAGARRYLEEAAGLYREHYGPRHPAVHRIENNLAALDMFEGRYAEAIPKLEMIAAAQEELLGGEHPELGNTLNNLANAFRMTRRYDEAVATHRRALAIREHVYGPRSNPVAQSLENLAVALRTRGELVEARAAIERAQEIRTATLPADHPEQAMSVLQFGEQLAAEGDDAGALAKYDEALAMRERALGPDHPTTLLVLATRADLYARRGQTRAAMADLERVLTASITTGMDENVLADVRFDLAVLLPEGSRARARTLALDARRKMAEHPQLHGDEIAEIDAWLAAHPADP